MHADFTFAAENVAKNPAITPVFSVEDADPQVDLPCEPDEEDLWREEQCDWRKEPWPVCTSRKAEYRDRDEVEDAPGL